MMLSDIDLSLTAVHQLSLYFPQLLICLQDCTPASHFIIIGILSCRTRYSDSGQTRWKGELEALSVFSKLAFKLVFYQWAKHRQKTSPCKAELAETLSPCEGSVLGHREGHFNPRVLTSLGSLAVTETEL